MQDFPAPSGQLAAALEEAGVSPCVQRDGSAELRLLASAGDAETEESVVAVWDGAAITWADGATEERDDYVYLAMPEGRTLEDGSRRQLEADLERWRTDMLRAVEGMQAHDLQAAVDLEHLYETREEARRRACVLLGVVHQDVEDGDAPSRRRGWRWRVAPSRKIRTAATRPGGDRGSGGATTSAEALRWTHVATASARVRVLAVA